MRKNSLRNKKCLETGENQTGRSCINCRKEKPQVASCNSFCTESRSAHVEWSFLPAEKQVAVTINLESQINQEKCCIFLFVYRCLRVPMHFFFIKLQKNSCLSLDYTIQTIVVTWVKKKSNCRAENTTFDFNFSTVMEANIEVPFLLIFFNVL